MSALTAGAAAGSPSDADQSVPRHSRSVGTGISLGSGTGRHGIDGMLSGGAGAPTLAAAEAPGTGAAGGGSTPATDDAVSCTPRITPAGASRSPTVSELPGGIGSDGVPAL